MAEKFYCWPKWLPKAQQSGYSYEPTDRRTRTDMEVGSVLRVNYDTDETTLNCMLILNAVQAQWFEKFERELINQGATWFQMPIQAGGCIEWHTVRFASRPKASIMAPHYTQYDLKLDLWRRELSICMELEELMLCLSPEEIRGAASECRTFWMSLKKLQAPTWVVSESA